VADQAAPADRVLVNVTVLCGEAGGKYPHGHSVVVRGTEEALIIDPSLGLRSRGLQPRVDRVLNSHCHEDHLAGNHLFADVPWHLHQADLPGIRSLEGFLEVFGYPSPLRERWREIVVEDFHFVPRPDALGLRDGDVFDLGGGVRVEVVHTPGHTRGHCAFQIEPGGVLYLGDIELSSFGPYYGDAWSDLDDFERSLALVRAREARWYATFHHVGVLDGRAAFLDRLDRFTAVIASREQRLLAYLAEPHSLDEIVAHRFVYRPHDVVLIADAVERRSMAQHVDRLLRAGRLEEVESGCYRALG
jgi:glyoxylase-like metal-dependent hydrolase (beta-lactamase superfamily II)